MVDEEIKKNILRLSDDLENAKEINAENLRKLLADNKNTLYGKIYDFEGINSVDEYRKRVPLCQFSDLEQYMDMAEDSLTSYKKAYTLLSSGTMGVQKRFPLTHEALERYSSYIYDFPFFSTDGICDKNIHTSVFRSANENNQTILSGAYFRYLYEKGSFKAERYLGGSEFTFSDIISDVPYVKLRLALACPNLTSIASIFMYDVLLLFGYLENNWERLLSDMEKGVVSVTLPDELKEKLLELSSCDKERLTLLRETFEKGFDTPIVPKIWKELHFICGISGRLYKHQVSALKKYIGETPLYYFAYASSECMAGIALEEEKAEYTLLPQSAFYEFLPVDGDDTTVLLEEVEKGAEYQLVVSTFSGLYRYKTGDIIRICGFNGQSPVFEVLRRVGQIIDIAGEKLDLITATEAIDRLSKGISTSIGEFSMGIDNEVVPARYCLFMEEATKDIDCDRSAELFDEILMELSPDYKDVRGLGMVSRPVIIQVSEGAHEKLRSRAGSLSQSKPIVFLKDEQFKVLKAWRKA